MSRLTPIPFSDLLRRMQEEVEISQAIFDFPSHNWWRPSDELDFHANHFSHRASTPVGPAAGPHTQLAQNIVLSWLAGARILELKTVQENDHLEIPRPCIHVPNVGYNVEWSQELSVSESLREYAKASYLIAILKHTRAFGAFGDGTSSDAHADTVFDISVGYDLQGIQSDKMTRFLNSMRNPASCYDELRCELTGDLAKFRDLELPSPISNCVTLSTFHGCPAQDIELIARYLLGEPGFHVIIKFNPTLLGYAEVRELLIERLGYCHLELFPEAFQKDLQYDQALEMMRRLGGHARECGLDVGAKFTNTLVVANNPAFFPTQRDPYMYLSGRPLHVLAMNLTQRFREDIGYEVPVSFSAGVDRNNFPAAVACGMVPVTTCTDLLRQGGYARLPRYLDSLAEEMHRCRVTSREAYILAARGHGAEAVRRALSSGGSQVWEREAARLTALANAQPDQLPDALRRAAIGAGLDAENVLLRTTRIAGGLNGRDIVPSLATDPRYHARSNRKEPARIARELGLYDCSNCDLCISACPNDAVFAYESSPVEIATEHLELAPGGQVTRTPGRGYSIQETHQLAIVDNLCNECSNCEVYCPEHGAPYKLKEHVFTSLEAFCAAAPREGFARNGGVLYARLDGMEWTFESDAEGRTADVSGAHVHLKVQLGPLRVEDVRATDSEGMSFDTALFARMQTVWDSIFHSRKPNAVNPDPLSHFQSGRTETPDAQTGGLR